MKNIKSKVFNYILYRWHTGCQWHRLPIDPDPEHSEKKKLATMPFATIFASGAGTAVKQLGLVIEGAFFNADKAFDIKAVRKTCFNHGLMPNMAENKRNRKGTKRGRKRRFTSERSFAWVDKFRAFC